VHTRGVLWGALALVRSEALKPFSQRDGRTVAELIGPLAQAIRRHTTRPAESAAEPLPTGVLIVAADDTVVAATAAADQCLHELTAGGDDETRADDSLRIVYDATARARVSAPAKPATAVLRTPSGRWLSIQAAQLRADRASDDLAVTLGPAPPSQLLPAYARWHGLTRQEHNVLRLLTEGVSTQRIAHRLNISTYTAQDHLKAIYRKTGNDGRSELIASLA
jgi:DNA-binding CsgD family transcriptional regulator